MKTDSEKRNFNLTNTIRLRWDEISTGQANNQYLIFDTLDQGSALRHHDTRHLLPSLSYCANLELHRFSFLQTVRLARHTHDSKGYFLAFTSPWNQNKTKNKNKNHRLNGWPTCQCCQYHLPISAKTPTFLYDFNKPLVFCLGGIYAAQGPDDFPCNYCCVNIFTQSIHCKRKRVELIFLYSYYLHQDGINESLLTWSHFGNLFSTDFVSLPLRGQVLHSVSQFQTVQVSTHLTEEISDPTDLKALKFIEPIPSYYKKDFTSLTFRQRKTLYL